MQLRKVLVGSVVLAVAGVAGPSLARAEVTIPGIAAATKDTALHDLTPAQQWNHASDVGFDNHPGALGWFADDMGAKLSMLGRGRLLSICLERSPEDAYIANWAMCSADAKAWDLAKAKAELVAEKVSGEAAKGVTEKLEAVDQQAKKYIAYFDAEIPKDKGLQNVMRVVDDAAAQWKTYIDKNQAAFDRYVAMKDGVRSRKTNTPAFQNCWESTQAAFAKYVRVAKFPYEMSGEQLVNYASHAIKDPGSYIAAVSYGACAYSMQPAGESMFVAASGTEYGDQWAGPRTAAISNLMRQSEEQKFQDRSRSMGLNSSGFSGVIRPANADFRLAIITAWTGEIGTVKANGDTIHVEFKGDEVESCLNWKQTNKVVSYQNGSPIYDKVCTKRGMVANQENPVDIPKQWAAGVVPGNGMLLVNGFPVDVWNKKKKKIIAMFGVAIGK